MAFTADQVIEEAREQHPSFDPDRSPDGSCFRQVNRYTDELYRRAVEKNSTLYIDVLEQALPIEPFDEGIALPAGFIQFIGGHVSQTDGSTTELHVVPYRSRFDPAWYAPVYLVEGVVYLCGTADDWPDGTIYLHYIPAPTLPATESGNVPLPDSAKRVLVDQLAWWMARRNLSEESIAVPLAAFFDAWKTSEHEFLVWIAQRSRSEVALVREEW